jgi:hypothetical protein
MHISRLASKRRRMVRFGLKLVSRVIGHVSDYRVNQDLRLCFPRLNSFHRISGVRFALLCETELSALRLTRPQREIGLKIA